MKNKIIQEQRIKGYFIQAAKDMLKGEGLKSISVRNIADQAGYSYATLYNYFKDIKDLLFECIQDFQNECEEFVVKETSRTPRGVDKIKAISKAYVKYFVQYPGIFELFYLEKETDIESKQPTSELICSFLDKLCADEWDYCIKEEIVSIGNANMMKDILKYQIPGLLLFYLNRRSPSDYKDFIAQLETQLDRIVKVEVPIKKSKLLEPEILNFLFEEEENLLCFIHYTKDESIANRILSEGFLYTESFYNTAEQVTSDKLDLMYKHNMFKYYGSYIIVINISKEVSSFYFEVLKKNPKIRANVENILTEVPPKMNDNNDKVYLLPIQYIKGYVNYETGKIVTNSKYNPKYNSPVFAENIKQLEKEFGISNQK